MRNKIINLFNKTSFLEFFYSVLILLVFSILLTVLFPSTIGAACTLEHSKRCDPCYCPTEGNPLANPDFCTICPEQYKASCDACDASSGPPPPPAQDDCSGTPGEKAVCLAETQLGDTYALFQPPDFGSVPPPDGASEYDCIGLVGWAWYWSNGSMLRQGTSYYVGPQTEVSHADSKKGDVVDWPQIPGCPYPIDGVCSGHVGLCYEDGCATVISAVSAGVITHSIDLIGAPYKIFKVGR